MDGNEKKKLSESDICDLFITPAINKAGWEPMTQIRREVTLTPGPVVLRGNMSSRNKKKKKFADYVLSWEPGVPVTVVEAKDNHHTVSQGIQQALGYAEILDVPSAFSSNGDAFAIIKLLKDQGRAAVVLPDGFLFGEGMKTRLKQSLLEECNLHTIVRLPNGVFAPYTGIKTNLLFFTQSQPTEHVWYYEHPYPEGVKSYNKTKPMRFEEFATEIAWWGNEADGFKARVQTEQAWKVPVADIVARNYNLDIKNPHVGEQISHDPDELLAQYQRLMNEVADIRSALKRELAAAPGR